MDVVTWDPKKNKMVKAGRIEGKTFIREVKAEHFMRMIQGYAIQEDAINQLIEAGVNKVVIRTATGDLVSKLAEWLEPDIKVRDWGHGFQRLMPVARMGRPLVEKPEPVKRARAEQGRLI